MRTETLSHLWSSSMLMRSSVSSILSYRTLSRLSKKSTCIHCAQLPIPWIVSPGRQWGAQGGEGGRGAQRSRDGVHGDAQPTCMK